MSVCILMFHSILAHAATYQMMDAIQPDGITLQGYGIPGVLKKQSGYSTAALYTYGVCGNALRLAPKQWLDLGPNNDRCIGKFSKCTNGITIMLWVKIMEQSSKQFFFTNVYDFLYSTGLYAWLSPNENKHVAFICWKSSGRIGVGLSYLDSIVKRDEWHHLALICHPQNGVQIYLNGILGASESTWKSYSKKGDTDNNVYIGRFGKSIGVFYLDAYIDELIIFEYMLNANEILNIYQQRL